MLFCPSVNILYFALFLEKYCNYKKIMIEIGFNNSKECNSKENI